MPNRIIREEICSSESLNSLSDFEENFFYKIIVNCDDYGRYDARPAILKSYCYPLRERLTLKAIQDALLKLARVGCVKLYEVDGKPYLHIPTWEVYQQVRAKRSKFPEPDTNDNHMTAHDSNGYHMISHDITCSRNPIQSNPNPNQSESNPNPNPIQIYGGFDEFWQAYPKKVKKPDAEKAWKQVEGCKHVAEIIAAVQESKKSASWGKDGGQYIPYPASWLRGRRWEDEIETGPVDGSPHPDGGIWLDGRRVEV